MTLHKFICVHDNGESYVTWQLDEHAAREECTRKSRYGEPWKVLKHPSTMEVPDELEAHPFNPMNSELFGATKHCRDCGRTEAAHETTH